MGRRSICNDLIGTTFESKHWFSLDPCGLLSLSLSVSVHVYSLIMIGTFLTSNSTFSWLFYALVYVPTSLMALWSLFMASTTDPGAVPRGARPLITVRRATTSTLMNGGGLNASPDAIQQLQQQQDEMEGGGGGGGGNGNDAGAPTSSIANPDEPVHRGGGSQRRCYKCCENYKPPRAHHDSVTGRCIVKFDHFCPWVNNAIGALNHKFFVLFLLYTCAACVQTLFLLIMRVVHCGSHINPEETEIEYSNNEDESAMSSSTSSSIQQQEQQGAGGSNYSNSSDNNDGMRRYLASSSVMSDAVVGGTLYVNQDCEAFYHSHAILVLFIASVLFLIFTCAMGYEQIEAIQTNQGKIARMKQRVGYAGTEYARVTTEFNEMFGGTSNSVEWHWLVPIPIQFHPKSMKKVVLGYDYDDVSQQQQRSTMATTTDEPPNERIILDDYRHRQATAATTPVDPETLRVVDDGELKTQATATATTTTTKTIGKDHDVEMGELDGDGHSHVRSNRSSSRGDATIPETSIMMDQKPRDRSPTSSSCELSKRRGSSNQAVQSGQARIVSCQGCGSQLQAPMGFKFVYCPNCETVSDVSRATIPETSIMMDQKPRDRSPTSSSCELSKRRGSSNSIGNNTTNNNHNTTAATRLERHQQARIT